MSIPKEIIELENKIIGSILNEAANGTRLLGKARKAQILLAFYRGIAVGREREKNKNV